MSLLADREQRAVDDADHGQRDDQRGEVLRAAREQLEAVAQHAERADLVEHADQQHGGAGRGDSAAASGSQVWNGNSGALIANAMKKPRNSHFCTAGLSGTWISWLNRNEPWCPVARAAGGDTYSPITATSISRPPSRL